MTAMRRLRLTMSIIASLSFVLVLAPLGLTNNNASFAQMPNATNQTTANMTGQPETTILNKTTIPAQQTNVTVNQTTKPVSQQALQPLENLTQSQAANLSGIQNKTMVTPTGNATTTLVNKTTVPFNQTMVTGGSNQSQQQGQQQQQQTSNATTATTTTPPPSTGNTSGGNQSQQQGGENPLSKVPVLGKLFGGK
jgi:hypothetical protein